jgi:hypothetical protein
MARQADEPLKREAGAKRFAWIYFIGIVAITAAAMILLWLTRHTPRNEVHALEPLPIELLDRIQFGGTIDLASAPGEGTTVTGRAPLDAWTKAPA